jgi:hypothetical protein
MLCRPIQTDQLKRMADSILRSAWEDQKGGKTKKALALLLTGADVRRWRAPACQQRRFKPYPRA